MNDEARPRARALPAEIAAPICALWLAVDTLDGAALHRCDPLLVAGVRAAVMALRGMLGDADEDTMTRGLDYLADIVGLAPDRDPALLPTGQHHSHGVTYSPDTNGGQNGKN